MSTDTLKKTTTRPNELVTELRAVMQRASINSREAAAAIGIAYSTIDVAFALNRDPRMPHVCARIRRWLDLNRGAQRRDDVRFLAAG